MNLQNVQPHGRVIIRVKLKELLQNAVDINCEKMFFQRPHPKFSEDLPCLLIYFTDELSETTDTQPKNYRRRLTLVTEIQIEANSTIENFQNFDGTLNKNHEDIYLDSRAYEIEKVLHKDKFMELTGLVEDVKIIRSQPIQIVYEGQINVSALRIFWEIIWRDEIYNEITLDEFLNFEAKYEPCHPAGANAEDEVVIRTE